MRVTRIVQCDWTRIYTGRRCLFLTLRQAADDLQHDLTAVPGSGTRS